MTSLAVVSFILNIYIISLASSAIDFWRQQVTRNDTEPELSKLFADEDSVDINLVPMIIALFFDLLCFLAYLILVLTSVLIHGGVCCKSGNKLVVLSLTVLCPMF